MRDFLSYLYSGQIRPNEGTGRYFDELMPLERLSEKILEELEGEISERAQADLRKYIDCQQEIELVIAEDAFARGVSFATKFLVSALN